MSVSCASSASSCHSHLIERAGLALGILTILACLMVLSWLAAMGRRVKECAFVKSSAFAKYFLVDFADRTCDISIEI